MADKKIALDLEINIKKGDMTLGELNSQLENLGGTIQEQKDILIEFERELLELQAIQSQTAKNDFARQTQLKEKSDELKGAIKDQRLSIRELSNERTNASGALKDLTKESVNQSKVIAGLDKLTGGMATKVVKLYKGFGEGVKAVKGFTTGLSGMKKALLATGIGALVVALGLVVAYWEDIKDFIGGGNAKLKEQEELINKKLEKSEYELKLLELQEDILNEQGLSTKEIVKQKTENIEQSKELNRLALDGLKIQRDKLLAQSLEQNFLEKAIGTVSRTVGFKFSSVFGDGPLSGLEELNTKIDAVEEKALKFDLALAKIDSDEQKKSDKIKDDKQKASDKADAAAKKAADKKIADAEELRLAKEKEKALEDIRLGKIDTEAERRQEELDAVDRQYKALIELAKKYNQDTKELEDAQKAKKEEIIKKNAEADAAEIKAKADKKLKEQEDLIKTLEIKQEQDKNDFEIRRAEVDRREKILLEDKTLTDEQRSNLEKQFAAERLKISNEEEVARGKIFEQRLQIAGNILGAINGLTQAFAKEDEASQKKAFKLNKAFGIGQAIISTAVGISNALTAGGNPIKLATGTQFVEAGIVAATGAAQIATIAKSQFGGGANITSPTAPSLGSGGAGAAPVGFTQNLNNTQIPTTKVIVTETDIRRATRNIDGIYNKAVVVE